MTAAVIYFRNLWAWLRGIRWLWSHNTEGLVRVGDVWVATIISHRQNVPASLAITYKPGYGPWRFLPIYLTTYLAGTLAGYGVVSLSRAWFDRSALKRDADGDVIHSPRATPRRDERWAHPFARFMTRLLNWIFPGAKHGMLTGPRLWGSVNLRG